MSVHVNISCFICFPTHSPRSRRPLRQDCRRRRPPTHVLGTINSPALPRIPEGGSLPNTLLSWAFLLWTYLFYLYLLPLIPYHSSCMDWGCRRTSARYACIFPFHHHSSHPPACVVTSSINNCIGMSQMCIVEVESTINGDEDIHRRRYSYSSRRIAHFGPFSRSIRVPQSTNNIKTQKKTSKLSISGRNTESSKLRGGYEYSLPSFCGANSFLYTRTLFANRSLHSFLPNHHHPTTHNTPLYSIPPPPPPPLLHLRFTIQCPSYNKSVFLTSSRMSCRRLQLVIGHGFGLLGNL